MTIQPSDRSRPLMPLPAQDLSIYQIPTSLTPEQAEVAHVWDETLPNVNATFDYLNFMPSAEEIASAGPFGSLTLNLGPGPLFKESMETNQEKVDVTQLRISNPIQKRKRPESPTPSLICNRSSHPQPAPTRGDRVTPRANPLAYQLQDKEKNPLDIYNRMLAAAISGDPAILSSSVYAKGKENPLFAPKPLNLPSLPVLSGEAPYDLESQNHPDYHLLAHSKNDDLAIVAETGVFVRNGSSGQMFLLADEMVEDDFRYNLDDNVAVSVAFNQAANHLIVGTKNGGVDDWKISTDGKCSLIFSIEINHNNEPESGDVTAVAAQNGFIFAATTTGRLYFITDQGKVETSIQIFEGNCQNLISSPNKKYLLVTGRDVTTHSARLFQFNSHTNSYEYLGTAIKGISSDLRAAVFSPDGDHLAFGIKRTQADVQTGTVSIYEIRGRNEELKKELTLSFPSPATHIFWPKKNSILTTHENGTIQSHGICVDTHSKAIHNKHPVVNAHHHPIVFSSMNVSNSGSAMMVTISPEDPNPMGQSGVMNIFNFQIEENSASSENSTSKLKSQFIR